MLIFDQLRISDNGKKVYINFHVNKATYFDNVTLDSITVIPALSGNGNVQISETECAPPEDKYIYKKVYGENVKSDDIVLDNTVLAEAFNNTDNEGEPIHDGATAKATHNGTFSNELLFVYVKCKLPVGELNPCIPCDSDCEMTTVGVTFDEALLYQKVMQFTKELADTCNISKGFVDMILLWNGFKAAIETGHYIPAIDFWKKLFFGYPGMSGIVNSKPCGCHG